MPIQINFRKYILAEYISNLAVFHKPESYLAVFPEILAHQPKINVKKIA